jgi:hypothetical protein
LTDTKNGEGGKRWHASFVVKTVQMRKTILLFVALWQIVIMDAQTTVIDGLKQSLQNEKKDTAKVMLLTNLSLAYLFSDPDSALLFAQKGLILARQINLKRAKLNVLERPEFPLMCWGTIPRHWKLNCKH